MGGCFCKEAAGCVIISCGSVDVLPSFCVGGQGLGEGTCVV